MQGYQIHVAALADGHLMIPCAISHMSWLQCMAYGGLPAIPGSPGHAKDFPPYPPSRRGRQ